MSNILIAKAVAALETSVASILNCDDSDEVKRFALAESFTQFEDYIMKHNGGADVAKANRGDTGYHNLAARVVEHMIDRLGHERQRYGFEKKEISMESVEKLQAERTEKLLALGKSAGAVAVAKILVADNDAHGLNEHEYTQIMVEHAKRNARDGESESQAFSRIFSGSDSDSLALRKAHQIVKAMPFQVDLQPLVVGGEANRGGDVNPDDPAKAVEQLKELGRRKWPTASEAVQFENALVDPVNHKLARLAVPIPRATTSYPFPR